MNGLAKTTFEVVDLSYRHAAQGLTRACVLVKTRRGPKRAFVGSPEAFDRLFGVLLTDPNEKGALMVRRALDMGASFYVGRALHYGDATDASTVDGTEAESVLKESTAAAPTLTLNGTGWSLKLTSKDGNPRDFAIVDPGTSNAALEIVATAGNSGIVDDIQVSVATGADSLITSTAEEIAAALTTAQGGLISVEVLSGAEVVVEAASGTLTTPDVAETARIAALGVGPWPNAEEGNLRYQITDNAADPATFDLELSFDEQPELAERFVGLSMNPQHARYAPGYVNTRSNLVRFYDLNAGVGDFAARRPVETEGFINFKTAGSSVGASLVVSDFTGDRVAGTGWHVFDDVMDANRIFTVEPAEYEVHTSGEAYARGRNFHDLRYLAVIPDIRPEDAVAWRYRTGAYEGEGTALDSRFAVFYYGHYEVRDPRNSARVMISCIADVFAVGARIEKAGQPWTAKAGEDAVIPGVISFSHNVGAPARQAEGDLLINAQINPVLAFQGSPAMIWGEKTAQQVASAAQSLHVNDLLIVMERALRTLTRSDLFKPNNWRNWRRIYLKLRPVFRDLQRREAFVDHRIFCDQDVKHPDEARLNIPSVVENEEFILDAYIKPTPIMGHIKLRAILSQLSARFEELFEVTPPAA
jgi:hypothetical protein